MTTHATITVKGVDGEFHANMLADGYPQGFSRDLRAIIECITPPEPDASPNLEELSEAFFSPLQRDRTNYSPALVKILQTADTIIQRSTRKDNLGDAWYRYEIDADKRPIVVTAFGRNFDDVGLPSLRDGWRTIFSGTLLEFYQWSQKFDPDDQAEEDRLSN